MVTEIPSVCSARNFFMNAISLFLGLFRLYGLFHTLKWLITCLCFGIFFLNSVHSCSIFPKISYVIFCNYRCANLNSTSLYCGLRNVISVSFTYTHDINYTKSLLLPVSLELVCVWMFMHVRIWAFPFLRGVQLCSSFRHG